MKAIGLTWTIILGECIFFMYSMVFFDAGWRAIQHADHAVSRLEHKLTDLTQIIKNHSQELNAWRSEPLRQERIARCELGLARDDELVYLFQEPLSNPL